MDRVAITVYQSVGDWSLMADDVPDGECIVTENNILDILESDLKDIDFVLEMRDWSGEWWKPLLKGAWRTPIVMINNTVVSQGQALTGSLMKRIVAHVSAGSTDLTGNHVFGRNSCPYCILAKKTLDEAGIDYTYHEIDKDKQAMYEMHLRVKPILGSTRSVTVPQIWLGGKYIGGADAVARHFTFIKRQGSVERVAQIQS